MQSLPQELKDLVISHFEDDVTTLRYCSTVCRTWVRPSQSYLFRCISLYDDQFGGGCESLHLYNCLKTSPHLASYTRRLFMHLWPQEKQTLEPQQWSELEETLILLLPMFGKLEYFGLFPSIFRQLGRNGSTYFSVGPILMGTINTLCQMPLLKDVRLGGWSFHTFAEFTSLISGCRSLAILSLFRLQFDEKHDGVSLHDAKHESEERTQNISIESLDVHGCNLSFLLYWISNPQICVIVKALRLVEPGTRHVNEILKLFSYTLERFHLEVDQPYHLKSVDLGCIRSLHSLSLHVAKLTPVPAQVPLVRRIFSFVPKQHRIVHIEIYTWIYLGPEGFDFRVWNAIDEVVSQSQFSNLRSLDIQLTAINIANESKKFAEDILNRVEQGLPLARKRGILRVHL